MHFDQLEVAEETQNICKRCKKIINSNDIKTHYHTGYECKTITCEHCKQINIVGYREQYGFDVNKDKRFYTYRR